MRERRRPLCGSRSSDQRKRRAGSGSGSVPAGRAPRWTWPVSRSRRSVDGPSYGSGSDRQCVRDAFGRSGMRKTAVSVPGARSRMLTCSVCPSTRYGAVTSRSDDSSAAVRGRRTGCRFVTDATVLNSARFARARGFTRVFSPATHRARPVPTDASNAPRRHASRPTRDPARRVESSRRPPADAGRHARRGRAPRRSSA